MDIQKSKRVSKITELYKKNFLKKKSLTESKFTKSHREFKSWHVEMNTIMFKYTSSKLIVVSISFTANDYLNNKPYTRYSSCHQDTWEKNKSHVDMHALMILKCTTQH